jgi:hypothetical protein
MDLEGLRFFFFCSTRNRPFLIKIVENKYRGKYKVK